MKRRLLTIGICLLLGVVAVAWGFAVLQLPRLHTWPNHA